MDITWRDANKMARRCRRCGARHEVFKDENRQHTWELTGFCSYTCEAKHWDDCWEYEKEYRP